MKLFEKIFSIKNKGVYKVITFLGIVIKINKIRISKRKMQKLEVQENKIVFSSFMGNSYGCNPKYIAEEIIKRKLPYDLVWLVLDKKKKEQDFPPEIRLVSYNSKQAMIETQTAKCWIDNNRKIYFWRNGLTKKTGQYYIQTWHGSLGIKKIDADVKAFNNETNNAWLKFAHIDSENADYLLSNSEFENNILVPAFWFKNEVKQIGHPRNDVFFKNRSLIRDKVCEYYNTDKDKKILLWVPSFRDDKRLDCYGLEYKELKKSLEEKFGGEWLIFVRLHPRINQFSEKIIPQKDFIINATDYPDIQELLVTADAAITDYSSCIFDFMLSRKPGFIYATDIEQYDTDRGFYYPLTSTPFPVAENNKQLRKNILNFDLDKYQEKVEEFLKDKGCMEDGHASERVVDLIEKIMKGENND